MATLEEISAFLVDVAGVPAAKIHPEADLCRDLGIDGDDFFDLTEQFALRFKVDMSAFRWYFHHGEEGFTTPGRLLFKPPNRQVPRISVTPALLQEAANAGTWVLAYPEIAVSTRRLYTLFDRVVFGGVGLVGLVLLAARLLTK